MSYIKMFERVEEKFFNKLDTKTGWGKEQIKLTYKEAVTEVALERIDEVSTPSPKAKISGGWENNR